MKKMILLIACVATIHFMAAATAPVPNDTTIILKGKSIEMTDNDGRTKVKVYKDADNNGKELIYESHYRDASEDEDQTPLSLDDELAPGDTIINVGNMSMLFMQWLAVRVLL